MFLVLAMALALFAVVDDSGREGDAATSRISLYGNISEYDGTTGKGDYFGDGDYFRDSGFEVLENATLVIDRNVKLVDYLKINAGATLVINEGIAFEVTKEVILSGDSGEANTFYGELENAGTIEIKSEGSLKYTETNNGFENSGTIEIKSGGTLRYADTGEWFDNYGTIDIDGVLEIEGELSNSGGTIKNKGSIKSSDTFISGDRKVGREHNIVYYSGLIENNGEIKITDGSFSNVSDYSESEAKIINRGSIIFENTTDPYIKNFNKGLILNYGTITATDDGKLNNYGGGIIANAFLNGATIVNAVNDPDDSGTFKLILPSDDKEVSYEKGRASYVIDSQSSGFDDINLKLTYVVNTNSDSETGALPDTYPFGTELNTYSVLAEVSADSLFEIYTDVNNVPGDLVVKQLVPEISITAKENLTYASEDKTLIEVTGVPDGYEIQYSTDGEYYSTTIPEFTDAGTYSVHYKAAGTLIYEGMESKEPLSVTVAKATLPDFTVSMAGFTYGETATDPSVSGVAGDGDVTYSYRAQGSTDRFGDNKVIVAGTHEVMATVAEGTNYLAGEATSTYTVAKATLPEFTVSMADFTYGETATEPSVSNLVGGGDVTYEYKAQGSESFGNVKVIVAGTHTVKAKVAESDNYKAGEATSTYTVAKANPVFTVSMAGFTYGGTATEPSVTGVDEGDVTYYYCAEGSINFETVKVVIAGTHTVKAMVGESDNYKAGQATAEYTVAKADLTLELTMGGFCVGDEPTVPSLTGNVEGGTVTYSYKAHGTGDYGDEVVTVAGTHTVRAVVEATANYNSAEVTAEYTVSMTPAGITVDFGEDVSSVYDGEPKTARVTGGLDFDDTYYTISFVKNGTDPAVTEFLTAGTYDVIIALNDGAGVDFIFDGPGVSEDHRSITLSSALTIEKADYDMSGVSFHSATKKYNRLPQHLEISGTLPTGADGIQVTVSYSGSATTAKDGPRTITAVFATESENYNVPASMTATLKIDGPAEPAPVDYDSGSGKTTEKSKDDDDGVSDAVIACIAAVAAAAAVIVAIVFFRQQ